MESPAASAEVQPAGRRVLEFRSNLAPLEASHAVPTRLVCHVSQMRPMPGCTMIECRSPPSLLMSCCHSESVRAPVSRGQVSTGMFVGMGYGLGSDSSAYSRKL